MLTSGCGRTITIRSALGIATSSAVCTKTQDTFLFYNTATSSTLYPTDSIWHTYPSRGVLSVRIVRSWAPSMFLTIFEYFRSVGPLSFYGGQGEKPLATNRASLPVLNSPWAVLILYYLLQMAAFCLLGGIWISILASSSCAHHARLHCIPRKGI